MNPDMNPGQPQNQPQPLPQPQAFAPNPGMPPQPVGQPQPVSQPQPTPAPAPTPIPVSAPIPGPAPVYQQPPQPQFAQPMAPPVSTPAPQAPGMPMQPMQPYATPYQNPASTQEGGKSYIGALLLSVLLGVLGVDRFYLGYVGLGVLKLVTFGGLGFWAVADVILIALGKLKDKQGNPLNGSQKLRTIGIVILALYLVWIVYSFAMLPARLKQIQSQLAAQSKSAAASTSSYSTLNATGKSIKEITPDDDRRNDLGMMQAELGFYGSDHKFYPTFTNINDATFRKDKLYGLLDSDFKDPEGASSQLVSAPQAKAYAYIPAPAGCNNTSVKCTSYTLTAVMSTGEKLVEKPTTTY